MCRQDEVRTAYDQLAENTSVGIIFYQDELTRRSLVRAAQQAARLAKTNVLVVIVAVVVAVVAIVVPILTAPDDVRALRCLAVAADVEEPRPALCVRGP
jgi:hypothetical protein